MFDGSQTISGESREADRRSHLPTMPQTSWALYFRGCGGDSPLSGSARCVRGLRAVEADASDRHACANQVSPTNLSPVPMAGVLPSTRKGYSQTLPNGEASFDKCVDGRSIYPNQKNEAHNCKLNPEGALPSGSEVRGRIGRSGGSKRPALTLNSAGLWGSSKTAQDVARSREGYATPETRVKCGKDARPAWRSIGSQQKQRAMPKSVCASGVEWIASHSRQGSNFLLKTKNAHRGDTAAVPTRDRGSPGEGLNPGRSISLRATARGTGESHELQQRGATPRPAAIFPGRLVITYLCGRLGSIVVRPAARVFHGAISRPRRCLGIFTWGIRDTRATTFLSPNQP